MKIFDWLLGRIKTSRTALSDWVETNWGGMFGGVSPVSSAIPVTPLSAMRTSAVYACVRILSEDFAALPLNLYKRSKDSSDTVNDLPLAQLMGKTPNPELNRFRFYELAMVHIQLWGNFYAEKEFDNSGELVALWPLAPWATSAVRDPITGLKYFRTHITIKGTGGVDRILHPYRVLHIPALSFDGLVGYSPIEAAAEAIGLAQAAEQFGGKFFAQGTRPSGILEHPGKLGDKALAHLQASFAASNQGLSNAHRFMILEEGMKWAAQGIPPNQAQFLETRQFQIGDIARIFRVPPHMIGDLSKATFSNIEHQSLDYTTHTLAPWCSRWEAALYADLLDDRLRKKHYFLFDMEAMQRGDIKSRYSAYALGRQWGWLCVDDIRHMENKPALPDNKGQIFLTPMNMMDAAKDPVDQEPKPTEEPTDADKN